MRVNTRYINSTRGTSSFFNVKKTILMSRFFFKGCKYFFFLFDWFVGWTCYRCRCIRCEQHIVVIMLQLVLHIQILLLVMWYLLYYYALLSSTWLPPLIFFNLRLKMWEYAGSLLNVLCLCRSENTLDVLDICYILFVWNVR